MVRHLTSCLRFGMLRLLKISRTSFLNDEGTSPLTKECCTTFTHPAGTVSDTEHSHPTHLDGRRPLGRPAAGRLSAGGRSTAAAGRPPPGRSHPRQPAADARLMAAADRQTAGRWSPANRPTAAAGRRPRPRRAGEGRCIGYASDHRNEVAKHKPCPMFTVM